MSNVTPTEHAYQKAFEDLRRARETLSSNSQSNEDGRSKSLTITKIDEAVSLTGLAD